MKINNRRYIGCKTKLIDEIFNISKQYNFEKGSTFADLFGGTGVVTYKFAQEGYKTLINDILYSNYVAYMTFFGEDKINESKLSILINRYNSIDDKSLQENYFSNIYGDKYFSINDAKKIGFIREKIEIEKKDLNKREYYYLITSLMYAADRIANTVGHFESFLAKKPIDKGIHMQQLDIDNNFIPSVIFNCDANEIANKIDADIVYIDPPYNARQYINFYHVLENLCRWNKPNEFEGNSMKFKRNFLKSDYCRKKAPQLFADLIDKIKAKIIIVSYNNTYTAGIISSINTISEEEIYHILKTKGEVEKHEINYNAFNAGKTRLKEHKEYLFVCKVK